MKQIAIKDLVFVGIQAILLLIFFIPVSTFPFYVINYIRFASLGISVFGILVIIIAILQLNKSLTPFPTPKESGTLIKVGLYKYARHPIYSGIILTSIFLGIFDESIWKITIGFALYLLFFFKSQYEEKMLIKHYKDYTSYKLKTRRFFPFL